VLIRLVLIEIHPFKNENVNKEMYGHQDAVFGRLPDGHTFLCKFGHLAVISMPRSLYKFFWSDFGTEMTASFDYAFQKGSPSIRQKRGIISLIPKKNKDKTLLDNLGPISLLNVYYKILTKSIAKRLEKVVPKIINSDQTGYIKGRVIDENVRLIQDVLSLTKQEEKPGIAIFLDFRKAFDKIKCNYLRAALQTFNFGPDTLNWLQVIYNQAGCLLHNGHVSDFFLLKRGV